MSAEESRAQKILRTTILEYPADNKRKYYHIIRNLNAKVASEEGKQKAQSRNDIRR